MRPESQWHLGAEEGRGQLRKERPREGHMCPGLPLSPLDSCQQPWPAGATGFLLVWEHLPSEQDYLLFYHVDPREKKYNKPAPK